MFSEKEIELQISDLNKMIFPDTVREKLIQLGMKEKPIEETLEGLSSNDFPFTKTVQYIQKKISSLLETENLYLAYKLNDTDKVYKTELGQILDNISILSKQLQQCEKHENSLTITLHDLDILLSTAFMIGRLTGCHDMKMVLQRQTENGVKSTVRNPVMAANAQKVKYKKVNDLILKMMETINNRDDFKIRQVDVAYAIHEILKNFILIPTNADLLAFKGFTKRYPSFKHIDKVIANQNTTLKSKNIMSRSDVYSWLSDQYSDNEISKLLA